MQTPNNRSDAETTTQEAIFDGNPERHANKLVVESRWTYGICLHWCYRLSKEKMLCCLARKTPKEEDGRIADVRARPLRVDSGVGLHLLGHEDSRLSPPAASALPNTITLIFVYKDCTTAKHVPYPAFSSWSAIDALLHELKQDGIIVHELWDMQEDMKIGSGDWDARIQSGSLIEAWCLNDARNNGWNGDSSDCESDNEMVESDGDGHDTESEYSMSWKSPAKNTRNEHTWWFARWRERVEKTTPGSEEVTSEPSWFFMVVWSTTTITIIAVLTLLNQ